LLSSPSSFSRRSLCFPIAASVPLTPTTRGGGGYARRAMGRWVAGVQNVDFL
jgi:hypothetical protein